MRILQYPYAFLIPKVNFFSYIGFILNLENLENRAIFTKSQGKPGIVRELFIIFIQIREKSGKTKHLVYI